MSHLIGMSDVCQTDTSSNSVAVLGSLACGLTATQWVLSHLCSEAGSQGVIRVRLAEFTMPKETKIWPCEGRALLKSGVQGEKMAPVVKPTAQSVPDSVARKRSSAG